MSEESVVQKGFASAGRALFAREGRRPGRPSGTYLPANEEPATRATWKAAAVSAVFLISVTLPLAGMILRVDSNFVLAENRAPAPPPELKLDRNHLAEFPARFEAYFNDRFGFRGPLIHWLNVIKVEGLRVSPCPEVILGQNGWLFHGGLYLDYYRATEPFTSKKLEMWRRLLESRQDWLAARGIPYLLVFVPIKSDIYPEFMPRVYHRLRAESRLDQLKAHLIAHSSLKLLDLREPLLAAKSEGQIYYRADTHWNNRGAYAGYARILETLSSRFHQLDPIPRSTFSEHIYTDPARNLALMLAMSNAYRESYSDLKLIRPRLAHEVSETIARGGPPAELWTGGPDIVFECPDRTLPRAVMFRDSFATWLVPLLSEHFQRIVYSWQYTMEHKLIERERPDIVIQEMVERALMNDDLPSQ